MTGGWGKGTINVTTNKIDQRLSIGMPLVELRGAEKRNGTIVGALAFSCVLAKWTMRTAGICQGRRQPRALRDAVQHIADEKHAIAPVEMGD